MKQTVLVIVLFLASVARAETLDSLYLSVRGDVKGNLKQVNHLLAQLDAQGWADSLYVFTNKDRRERIEATLALSMAYSCYDRGLYANAIELSKQVIDLCDILGYKEMKSDALAHLSTTLFRAGKLDQAVAYTIQGLHLDSTLNDMERLSSSFNNIAAFTLASGHYKDAEKYILKAISIEESLNDPHKLSIRYGVASEVYNNLKDYDKALDYITKAYELDRKEGNVIGAARRQSQMADIYLSQKEYVVAERLYTTAITTLREAHEPSSLVISLKQLGKVYSERGMWDKCLKVLQECDSLLRATGNKYQLMQITKLQADAYKAKADWQSAARCSDEALALREEIFDEQFEQMSADYSTRFQWMEQEKDTLAQRQGSVGWFHQICGYLVLILSLVTLALAMDFLRRRRKEASPVAVDQPQDEETVSLAQDAAQSQAEEPSTAEEEGDETAPNALENRLEDKLKNLSPEDDDMLFRIHRIILENPATADIETLKTRLSISHDSLYAFTMRTTGLAPKYLIQHYKMEYATKLLLTTDRTINDIATACGYYDNSYFGRLFARIYGVTPGNYRKSKGEIAEP